MCKQILPIVYGVEPSATKLINERLRLLRRVNKLTQEQVAELAGLDAKHYQSIEAGRKLDLRISTVEKLARAYGLQAWELLGPKVPKAKVDQSKVKPNQRKPR